MILDMLGAGKVLLSGQDVYRALALLKLAMSMCDSDWF